MTSKFLAVGLAVALALPLFAVTPASAEWWQDLLKVGAAYLTIDGIIDEDWRKAGFGLTGFITMENLDGNQKARKRGAKLASRQDALLRQQTETEKERTRKETANANAAERALAQAPMVQPSASVAQAPQSVTPVQSVKTKTTAPAPFIYLGKREGSKWEKTTPEKAGEYDFFLLAASMDPLPDGVYLVVDKELRSWTPPKQAAKEAERDYQVRVFNSYVATLRILSSEIGPASSVTLTAFLPGGKFLQESLVLKGKSQAAPAAPSVSPARAPGENSVATAQIPAAPDQAFTTAPTVVAQALPERKLGNNRAPVGQSGPTAANAPASTRERVLERRKK